MVRLCPDKGPNGTQGWLGGEDVGRGMDLPVRIHLRRRGELGNDWGEGSDWESYLIMLQSVSNRPEGGETASTLYAHFSLGPATSVHRER